MYIEVISEKLLFSHVYNNNYYSDLDEKDFDKLKTIFMICKSYYKKYKKKPSYEILKSELEKRNKDINILEPLLNMGDYNRMILETPEYIENKFNLVLKVKEFKENQEKEIEKILKGNSLIRDKNYDDIIKIIDKKESDDVDDYKSPLFDPNIYNSLPSLFKEIVIHFNKPREKDISLLSSLTIMSSLFDKVYIRNYYNLVNLNLYTFISATSGSGKGSVAQLIKSIDFKKQMDRFYNDTLTDKDMGYRKFKISGNISTSELINSLNRNDGIGIIYETETSILTQNKQNKWGDLTDVLLKAYEHETISKDRIDDKVEVDNPKLSVFFTGSPGSLKKFIPSVEDGLFSRFLYYYFDTEIEDKYNLFPDIKNNRNDFFDKELSKRTAEVYNHYRSGDYEIVLTEKQILEYNNFANEIIPKYVSLFGEHLRGILFRYLYAGKKIMSILTLFRKFEYDNFNQFENEIVMEDIDFKLGKSIIDTLVKHMIDIFFNTDDNEKVEIKSAFKYEKIVNDLPKNEFSTKYFIDFCDDNKINEINAKNILHRCTKNNLIKRIRRGYYKKN